MLLNRIEKLTMNNPLRAWIQRAYEGPTLERLGGRTPGARVLEIGCGRGVGTEIIFERFGASEVHAFDLDPDMVRRARRRLARFLGEGRLRLDVGDATSIDAPDASYDAVFDFGILHHVPDWRAAVAEVARVLKPGGAFFFEEVTRQALDRWAYRAFFVHPREDRFAPDDLVAELARGGIAVEDRLAAYAFGDFVVGVGRRVSGAAAAASTTS
jgi:ubiquinone/menaquinone biosynthesis C-methylase UbiE